MGFINLKKDVLSQYTDVSLWLEKQDFEIREKIINDTIDITAEHFSQSRRHVKYLIGRMVYWYFHEEVLIITFFYEHLRKIRDSRL